MLFKLIKKNYLQYCSDAVNTAKNIIIIILHFIFNKKNFLSLLPLKSIFTIVIFNKEISNFECGQKTFSKEKNYGVCSLIV